MTRSPRFGDSILSARRRWPASCLGSMMAATVGLLLAGCAAFAAGPHGVAIKSVERDPVFDPMFEPETRGFLGADGGASAAIPGDRVVWVFGDTIMGNLVEGSRKGSMVRNSIAIQDRSEGEPGNVEYFWDLTDKIPGDFFHPDDWGANYWYWPGVATTHNDNLYVLLTRLDDKADGPDGFNFRTIGLTLARIDNPEAEPEEWNVEKVDLGVGDQHFNINAGVLVRGGYVWLLGYDDPDDNPEQRRAVLARMPVEALEAEDPAAQIEYWSEGDTWRADTGAMQSLFTPGTTETSLVYNEHLDKYLALTIEPFQPVIYLMAADEPTGPWEKHEVFSIPEVTEVELNHAYAPRIHPFLTGNDREIVISYVVNTSDFWSMFSALDIYYLRFLRVTFE